jgi:hypothetical protein
MRAHSHARLSAQDARGPEGHEAIRLESGLLK